MKVIAGLGNPGSKYDGTRHNIGFGAIDYIAHHFDIKINKLGYKALYGQGTIDGEKVILIKPQTFMNLSGTSLIEAMNFYKLEPEDLIVIHDDIDLPTGKIRIRTSGSAGGHNGIKDIILHLNSDKFTRIKIGAGQPEHGKADMINHVLGTMSKQETDILDKSAEIVVKAIPLILKGNTALAMSKYNGKPDTEE